MGQDRLRQADLSDSKGKTNPVDGLRVAFDHFTDWAEGGRCAALAAVGLVRAAVCVRWPVTEMELHLRSTFLKDNAPNLARHGAI